MRNGQFYPLHFPRACGTVAQMTTTSSPPSRNPLERPSPWSLLATLTAGTAVVLALALVVTIGMQLTEDRPRASVGEVLRPQANEPLPSDASTVHLPWGPVTVGVGEATDEIPETFGDHSLVAPPDGGSFVRVDLQPAPTEGGDVPFVATSKPGQAEAEVVLTADGTEYPLDGPDGLGVSPGSPAPVGAHSRWVAIDGHPSDLEVSVTVADEEQVVDVDGDVTRGRGAALNDVPSLEELREKSTSSPCGGLRQSGSSKVTVERSDVPGCSVDASMRTPFVDGLGWAAKGKEYLVVQSSYEDPVDVTGSDDESWVATPRLDARLDGAAPEGRVAGGGTVLGVSGSHGDVETFVFEVPVDEPTGDLSLHLDLEAVREDPFEDGRPERRRLSWTVPGGGLA